MSKQTKHTPGPWSVKKMRDKGINARGSHYEIMHQLYNESGEYAGKPGGYTVVVGDKNCQDGYILSEANAQLIAAAPELLAALKGLFEHCAMVHKHWGDGDNSQAANAAQDAARAAIAKAEGN